MISPSVYSSMVWSLSRDIVRTISCNPVSPVSSLYDQTLSPTLISSIFFSPPSVLTLVPAGKQANTQTLPTDALPIILSTDLIKAFLAPLAVNFIAVFSPDLPTCLATALAVCFAAILMPLLAVPLPRKESAAVAPNVKKPAMSKARKIPFNAIITQLPFLPSRKAPTMEPTMGTISMESSQPHPASSSFSAPCSCRALMSSIASSGNGIWPLVTNCIFPPRLQGISDLNSNVSCPSIRSL